MKEFKKSDLKNRMVVAYRDGRRRMIVDDLGIGDNGFLTLCSYDNNLNYTKNNHLLDIVKVYDKVNTLKGIEHNGLLNLLWERSEVKEVTMTEVEEKFGCKVKIVKE